MKRLSIIAIAAVTMLALATVYCGGDDSGRRDATSTGAGGWIFEGWACAPDAAKALEGLSPAQYCTDDDDKEYLYMKFTARASDRAIRARSIAMQQSTCRRAARDQVAGDALSKLIGDELEQASGVVDGQSTGQAIIAQNRGLLRGVGIFDCCSLNPQTGKCAEPDEAETWVECQCVGYLRYPGGQDAMVAEAERIDAAN